MLEPVNEMGVIVILSQYCATVGWEILSVQQNFPDVVMRHTQTGDVYSFEIEYAASSFIAHGHDPLGCDAILCWENDFPNDVVFPIIVLGSWDGTPPEIIDKTHKLIASLQVENMRLRTRVNALEREAKYARGSGTPRNNREAILEMRRLQPNLNHKSIAEAVGVSRQYVDKVLAHSNGKAR